MGLTYYTDVHRTRKNGEGFRITFTTDGISFKQVDSFNDMPARQGDTVFVDVLPLQHTEGALELLRGGVEVYYLRRLTLIARKREELKLSKTARTDVRTLMAIEQKWFKRVTEDFLVLRRMIVTYRSLMRTYQQFMNKYRAVSEEERRILRPVVKALEQQMDELAKRIVDEAGRRYPAYNRLVGVLGINGNPSALEALAEVLVLPEWASWRRTKNYFGMWRRDKKTRFHRSKTARQALERLTISLKGYKIRGNDLKEVLKTIWITLKAQEAGPVPA